MQFLVDILYTFLLYLNITYSFSVCYRIMRFFHMAHAIALTFAAYILYTISTILAMPLWISIILSVSLTVLLLLIINVIIYLPEIKKKLEGWQLMIVSLGIYIVFQNMISLIWGDSTLSFRSWSVETGHSLLDGVITDVQIITILFSSFQLSAVWMLLEKTNIGLSIKAIASNPTLGSIYGIKKETIATFSVGLGSTLMAFTGIMIAADIDMNPTMGFDWLMYGVVAMIIGGMGKIQYMILGALLLATAQQLSAYFLDSKWMNATAYIILVIFLYFRPFGFSGKKLKKTDV